MELKQVKAKAELKRIRISPRKLGLVAGMIAGKNVTRALAELAVCQKRVAGDVRKVILSAIANAENNHHLDIDRLYVEEAYVGKSVTLRRYSAQAKGRGCRIQKPFSNLTVFLREGKGK